MGEAADAIGPDLRGRSFRGKDLHAVDLRAADLRGADLAAANLRGASLRGVRTGMRPGPAMLVALAGLALSIGSGAAAGWAGDVLRRALAADQPGGRALGVFVVSVLAVFLVATLLLGLEAAARRMLPVALLVAVTTGIIALASGAGSGRGALLAGTFLVGAAAIVAIAALARTTSGTQGLLMFAVVILSGALAGGLLGGGLTAAGIAVVTMMLGRRALKDHGKSDRLSQIASTVACTSGTTFQGADLSHASFEDATLHGADFRGAILEGTRFDRARIEMCRFDSEPPVALPPRRRAWPRKRPAGSS